MNLKRSIPGAIVLGVLLIVAVPSVADASIADVARFFTVSFDKFIITSTEPITESQKQILDIDPNRTIVNYYTDLYVLSWMPPGYFGEEVCPDEGIVKIIYGNRIKEISFVQLFGVNEYIIDNEMDNPGRKVITGIEYLYGEKGEGEDHMFVINWTNGSDCFKLYGDEPLDDLLKMASSMEYIEDKEDSQKGGMGDEEGIRAPQSVRANPAG